MKIKVFGLLMSMLISMFLVSTVAAEGTTVVYGKVESFTWKEHVAGRKLLEESGKLYGIGMLYTNDAKSVLGFKGRAELFGGTVDYDGHVMNILTGELTPSKTDTSYLGVKLEGDIGYRHTAITNFVVEPFAGLGYHGWRRDIKDSFVPALGVTAFGPNEVFHTIYGRLGARGNYKIAEKTNIFLEGGAKLPIWNKQLAEIQPGYVVTLKPDRQIAAFAEVGIQHKRLKASLYYEGVRFGQSPKVETAIGLVFQPESKADMFGARVGITF